MSCRLITEPEEWLRLSRDRTLVDWLAHHIFADHGSIRLHRLGAVGVIPNACALHLYRSQLLSERRHPEEKRQNQAQHFHISICSNARPSKSWCQPPRVKSELVPGKSGAPGTVALIGESGSQRSPARNCRVSLITSDWFERNTKWLAPQSSTTRAPPAALSIRLIRFLVIPT